MCQLIRSAILQSAVRTLERMLAQGEYTDEELNRFEQEFEVAVSVPWLSRAAQGERGALHYFLSSLAAGDVSDEMVLEALTGVSDKASLPPGAEIRRIHSGILQRCSEFLEMTTLAPEEQLKRVHLLDEQNFSAPWAQSEMARALIAGPFRAVRSSNRSNRSDFADLIDGNRRYLAVIGSAIAACAAERYRMDHGDWPHDLAVLVPTFLKQIPRDPIDGNFLRYRRTSDGVVIYSIGTDQHDNEGVICRSTSSDTNGFDFGFELWNVESRPRAGTK